jgi:hypothetical protein
VAEKYVSHTEFDPDAVFTLKELHDAVGNLRIQYGGDVKIRFDAGHNNVSAVIELPPPLAEQLEQKEVNLCNALVNGCGHCDPNEGLCDGCVGFVVDTARELLVTHKGKIVYENLHTDTRKAGAAKNRGSARKRGNRSNARSKQGR